MDCQEGPSLGWEGCGTVVEEGACPTVHPDVHLRLAVSCDQLQPFSMPHTLPLLPFLCPCAPAGSIDLGDLSRLVDAAASLTSADDVTLQDILETLDVPER